MKKLISHRGNLNGPNPERENHPDYIDESLKVVPFCEVDVWRIDDKFYLSHDYPDNAPEVEREFFLMRWDQLIIHCKNIEALVYFRQYSEQFHFFWHQEDDYTLTSWNWIWAYPGKTVPRVSGMKSVAVLPERMPYDTSNFSALCTDYVSALL